MPYKFRFFALSSLLISIGIVLIGSRVALATGESYAWGDSNKTKIVASGGVYSGTGSIDGIKIPNTFVKVTALSQGGVDQYSNISDDAESSNGYNDLNMNGKCRILLLVQNGKFTVNPSTCYTTNGATDTDVLDSITKGDKKLSGQTLGELTIGAFNNTEATDARVDATVQAFGSSLDKVKEKFSSSSGCSANTSSPSGLAAYSDCVNTAWKKTVYECWSKGRSDAATTARWSGQGGIQVDTAALTKDNFSACLADKMKGSGLAVSAIRESINDVDTAAINKAGDDAGKAVEDQQNGANLCADGSQKDASGNCPAAANAPSCGNLVDGIGWAVCPILDAIGGLNDAMWGLISGLLTVSPLKQEGSYYQLWGVLRVFANIILVLAFLAIIYSQLTNAGISNYGAKKMLPRLILMAILINLSFFIVSASVDLANLLGQGLYNLINSVGEQGKAVPQWSQVIGLIVGAGAAIGAGIGILATAGGIKAALILLIPVALIALLGFLAAILTLAVRQALIPLLAIFAPIAFAASLFPNTESLFKKWKAMFISMLMLYPIAAILFGGVQLAAIAMAGSNQNWFSTMLALLVMGAPLFMLPFIARQAGPMLGKLNSAVNGMSGKLRKPVGDWAGSHAKLAKARYDGAGIRTGKNGKPILRDRAKALRHGFQERRQVRDLQTAAHHAQHKSEFNESIASQDMSDTDALQAKYGAAGAAYMAATTEKAISESIGMHQTLMKGKGSAEWLKIMQDKSKSKEERAAAAGLIASSGFREHQLAAIQAASNMQRSGDSAAGNIQKQMLSEFGNRVPFALGDTERAAMMEGKYNGDIYERLAERAQSNLTPQQLASMDIDELRELANMSEGTSASGKTLSDDQRKAIADKIAMVENDDILKNSVAERDTVQYNRIRGSSGSSPADELKVPRGSGTTSAGPTPSTPRPAGPSSEERAYFGGDDRRD